MFQRKGDIYLRSEFKRERKEEEKRGRERERERERERKIFDLSIKSCNPFFLACIFFFKKFDAENC